MTFFTIRHAAVADGQGIAEAHVDSIRSLGAAKYDPKIVDDWAAFRTGERYTRRIREGAAFFVAVANEQILGFSEYHVEQGRHRTAVYVCGKAARIGIGSALFAAAESAARQNGAKEIRIDASLGAIPFYKANGFQELGVGEHELRSGMKMACMFMRKDIA